LGGLIEYYTGKIDDIGIWNRPLSACEVADLYNSQLGSSNSVSTTTLAACDSYTWNGQAYTQSGIYTYSTLNAQGCDSLATLNLTINAASSGSEAVTQCNSFTWPANGQTYSQTGVYNATLSNSLGCDSIVTLDLIINSVNVSVSQVSDITLEADAIGATYQWIDCKDGSPILQATMQMFTPTDNGAYAVVVTENGCTDTSVCINVVSLELEDYPSNLFLLYPNPTTSLVTLRSQYSVDNSYSVLDMSGREVLSGQMKGVSHTLLLTNLSTGVYFLVFDNLKHPPLRIVKE